MEINFLNGRRDLRLGFKKSTHTSVANGSGRGKAFADHRRSNQLQRSKLTKNRFTPFYGTQANFGIGNFEQQPPSNLMLVHSPFPSSSPPLPHGDRREVIREENERKGCRQSNGGYVLFNLFESSIFRVVSRLRRFRVGLKN